jgi:hypothetical protein
MPSNNWGPYTSNIDGPVYPPTATPPPTGQLDPPQSPSGGVTNESATWNYANSETSTENYVSAMVAAAQDAVPFDFQANIQTSGDLAGKFDVETIPSPPSGSFIQEGSPAISNTLAISESFAGVAPASIAVNNFGATGNV